MVRFLGQLGRLLQSLKLTAGIIALLIVLFFLGLVVPQKWMFPGRSEYIQWIDSGLLNRVLDGIGFTDIYFAPLTLALLGLFFINLSVVIIGRLPLMLQRAYLRGTPPPFTATDIRGAALCREIRSPASPRDVLDGLRGSFRKWRWAVVPTGQTAMYVIKNRFSPLGFFLFHLSFLLCLAGGLLIFATRFSGNLVLTEGQTFENDIKKFRQINREPRVAKELPSLELFLRKVRPFYEKDKPSQLEVMLQVRTGNRATDERLLVNEPFQRGALTIIAEQVGVSPLFEVLSKTGATIDGAYISLNVLKGDEDTFQFESLPGYVFRVRFFPDYLVRNGIETTRSPELRNPAVRLTIDQNGKIVYAGTIRVGGMADAGPFQVRVPDVRYWVDLKVVREYGTTPLITGFLLGAVGLIMRLIFYQKRLRVAVEPWDGGSLMVIDGKSEQFPDAFAEEFRDMMDEIDARAQRG